METLNTVHVAVGLDGEVIILILVSICIGGLFAIRGVIKSAGGRHDESEAGVPPPGVGYRAIESLVTPAEWNFYSVLETVVGRDLKIFAKVRLADIITPKACESRSARTKAFNQICSKHVDFVVCDPKGLRIVAAIELDDKSHDKYERGFRDKFLQDILREAQIPLLRVRAQASYSPTGLADQLAQVIAARKPSSS